MSRDRRAAAVALIVGMVHAIAIAALVRWLDYPLDALANAPGGLVGAFLGLTLLLAVPTFVAVRHGLVTPLVAAVLGTGWPIFLEFATPRPEFSETGGYTIVIGPRYVDAYVDAWYIWLLAYLLLAAAEYVVRVDVDRLPSPRADDRLDWLRRRDRRAALRAAGVLGVVHAAVFLLLAADSGYFVPGGFLPSPWYVGLGVLAWTVVGLVAIGGMAGFLLGRWRLLAPTVGLAWLVRETGWTQGLPLPDDALPVYFLGWFFFAGGLVVVGGAEWVIRAAGRRLREP